MESSKDSRRSKKMSTLEKMLIFLFVAMTGVSITFIVLYFVNQPTSDQPTTEQPTTAQPTTAQPTEEPNPVPGECVICENAPIFCITWHRKI